MLAGLVPPETERASDQCRLRCEGPRRWNISINWVSGSCKRRGGLDVGRMPVRGGGALRAPEETRERLNPRRDAKSFRRPLCPLASRGQWRLPISRPQV
jgi:hypothetical protein